MIFFNFCNVFEKKKMEFQKINLTLRISHSRIFQAFGLKVFCFFLSDITNNAKKVPMNS